LLRLGKVLKTQGRRGELKVKLFTEPSEKLFFFTDIFQQRKPFRRIPD
jgi:ribosomal 30S subunit maturation factor RimM